MMYVVLTEKLLQHNHVLYKVENDGRYRWCLAQVHHRHPGKRSQSLVLQKMSKALSRGAQTHSLYLAHMITTLKHLDTLLCGPLSLPN